MKVEGHLECGVYRTCRLRSQYNRDWDEDCASKEVNEAMVAAVEVSPSKVWRRGRYLFAGTLDVPTQTPSQQCTAFRNLSPEEREKIMKDINMCPFCLQQEAAQEYHRRDTEMKPVCQKPEWGGKHTKLIHDLMIRGLVVMIVMECEEDEEDEKGPA
jgi:hypothetical protein